MSSLVALILVLAAGVLFLLYDRKSHREQMRRLEASFDRIELRVRILSDENERLRRERAVQILRGDA